MITKRLFLMVLLVILGISFIAPYAGAQEGPPQVGLRPDAPPYAVHGPYWVGTREFVIEEGSDYPIPVIVWYPALNPDGLPEQTEYLADVSPFVQVPEGLRPVVKGHALDNADADLSGAPYPLVIFSSGGSALTPALWAHLTEHLASWGFVVIGPKHLRDLEPFYIGAAFRVREILRAITYADTLTVAGGALDSAIDTERIAVMGHSSGGLVSYGMGGASLVWSAIEAYCAGAPEDPACTDLSGQKVTAMGILGLEPDTPEPWPPIWDPRVDAIIAMSGSTEMYGRTGLASLTIPMMVLTGSGDTLATPELVLPSYESASSSRKALVLFENGWHTLFMDKCANVPWLVDLGLAVVCSDFVWDMDRAHDLSYHFTTAFLLATLKGDADAAAALAPDAVAFPGITYEAQGF